MNVKPQCFSRIAIFGKKILQGPFFSPCWLFSRDNQICSISSNIGCLKSLKELHLQGNRLRLLPPELADLEELDVLKIDKNPWILPIADTYPLGKRHLFNYIRSSTYRIIYKRQTTIPFN